MSSINDFDIETLLDAEPMDSGTSLESESGGTEISSQDSWREEGYSGSIDYRLRQLSYSSVLLLHECPRKFQLNKCRVQRTAESLDTGITFSFGHVIGQAIQDIFIGLPKNQIYIRAIQKWNVDFYAVDEKRHKSFWLALYAIEKFIELRKNGFLAEYEIVYFNGRPAAELGFCINLQEGFRYRGFADLILQHVESKKVIVLEGKTFGADIFNPAIYKNSSQALGYSIILDHIFPDLSSYEVLYLIYESKNKEFTPIVMPKTYSQRARWIREIVLNQQTVEIYANNELFPMHGESCISRFGRECEYFGVCHLDDDFLIKKCTKEAEDKNDYDVTIELSDLIETQLKKV